MVTTNIGHFKARKILILHRKFFTRSPRAQFESSNTRECTWDPLYDHVYSSCEHVCSQFQPYRLAPVWPLRGRGDGGVAARLHVQAQSPTKNARCIELYLGPRSQGGSALCARLSTALTLLPSGSASVQLILHVALHKVARASAGASGCTERPSHAPCLGQHASFSLLLTRDRSRSYPSRLSLSQSTGTV